MIERCVASSLVQGLRKVTNDMKTYKNPALRASSVVKAGEKPAPSSAGKPSAGAGAQAKKNPVFELVMDKKWTIVRVLLVWATPSPPVHKCVTNTKWCAFRGGLVMLP